MLMELMARGKFSVFAYNFLVNGPISIFFWQKQYIQCFWKKVYERTKGAYNNLTLLELDASKVPRKASSGVKKYSCALAITKPKTWSMTVPDQFKTEFNCLF